MRISAGTGPICPIRPDGYHAIRVNTRVGVCLTLRIPRLPSQDGANALTNHTEAGAQPLPRYNHSGRPHVLVPRRPLIFALSASLAFRKI
jgi:hypothetical protein